MPIQSAEDLFLAGLSHLHRSEQRLLQAVEEMSQVAQDEEIKEVLDVRAYLTRQEISNIEKCFQLLGKQPVPPSSTFADVWVENVRRELSEIQSPTLKGLFILNKVRQIQDLHMGEYKALATMSGLMGNIPVTTLLEHNLRDKVEFVERTRDLVLEVAKKAIGARVIQRVAA